MKHGHALLSENYGVFRTIRGRFGLILGPLAETQFRRALAISEGDPSVFVTQPISATLLALAVAAVLGPWIWRRLKRA
jgi:putative tricarboxylic transport membrane protein